MQISQPSSTPLNGTLYRYYFVGHGAQFRVYSIYTLDNKPTGRVIKVPLDFDETKQSIMTPLRLYASFNTEEEFDELADKRAREVMQFKHDMPNLMQGILGQDKNFMHKLGNIKVLQAPIPAPVKSGPAAFYLPVFFTQDYVMTLDTYLQHFRLATISYTRELDVHNIRLLKHVIRQMISLNYLIWEYGIFEFVFKPENLGIRFTKQGTIELMWMDLAEHITNLKEAEAIIQEQRWLHPLMPHKIDYQFMPAVLHEYYTEACYEAFTVENLRKHWRKRCIRAESYNARKLRVKELLNYNRKESVTHWVDRHNLSVSLYRGFHRHTIDDMDIPIPDLELLLRDKHRANPPENSFREEKIERTMARTEPLTRLLFPLATPQDKNHQKASN